MNLKAARESAGLTQAQAAEKANVSERMYLYYEADKKEPRVRTAIRIADALGCDVKEIFKVQKKPDYNQAK